MRRNYWLVLGLFGVSSAVNPTELMAQRGGGSGGFPGGGGGFPSGSGGGGGRPQMDPEMLWQRMSGGSDSIDLNKNAQMKMMVQMGGGQMPPDGILTKTMFQTAMAQRAARTAGPSGVVPGGPTAPSPGGGAPMVISVGGGGGDKPTIGTQPPSGFPGGGGGFPGGGGGRGNMWGDPENLFQRIDRNRDGKITKDETQMLLPYFDQIDTNKDGGIDLAELKVFSATMAAASPGSGSGGWSGPSSSGSGGDPRIEDPETERPVVYRFGKLPKDFPYASIDKDEDGQVSLYEWRNSGKSVEEFLDRDLNGDGFLTAEEWLRGTKTSLSDSKDKGGKGNSGAYQMGSGRKGKN